DSSLGSENPMLVAMLNDGFLAALRLIGNGQAVFLLTTCFPIENALALEMLFKRSSLVIK
ncbi:MAG: hypothetical protein AAGA67_10310, partial [Cyanobacteria bacterium P01_F01_bin.153]